MPLLALSFSRLYINISIFFFRRICFTRDLLKEEKKVIYLFIHVHCKSGCSMCARAREDQYTVRVKLADLTAAAQRPVCGGKPPALGLHTGSSEVVECTVLLRLRGLLNSSEKRECFCWLRHGPSLQFCLNVQYSFRNLCMFNLPGKNTCRYNGLRLTDVLMTFGGFFLFIYYYFFKCETVTGVMVTTFTFCTWGPNSLVFR